MGSARKDQEHARHRAKGEIERLQRELAAVKEELGVARTERDLATARFDSFSRFARELMVAATEDGTCSVANPAAARILGFESIETMVGSPAVQVYRDPEVRQQLIEGLRERGYAEDLELEWQTPDGETVYLEGTAFLVTDDQGRVLERAGVFAEVSDRMEAATALSESEERFRLLFEAAPLAIALLDAEGVIKDCNPACARICGLSTEEMVGRHFLESQRAVPELAEEHLQLFDGIGEGGGDPTLVTRLARRDGSDVLIEASLIPLQSGNARPEHQILFRDVTKQKQAEQEILSIHEDLERSVDARTVALKEANDALETEVAEHRQARESLYWKARELERSNAELESFSRIATHDLKESLRMVSSFLQLLEDEVGSELGPSAQEYVEFSLEGADRMRQMLDDLLTYSRLGSPARKVAPVDMEAALEAVLAELKPGLQETGARVSYGPLPTVFGDEEQLSMVFRHLIANALKFRGDEPLNARVESERRGSWWSFSVRDNGMGTEPQHSERIFEIFQRLHTREAFSGTGIGLALCKKIIEQHGGRIWAESEVGEGSSFCFTLRAEEDGL